MRGPPGRFDTSVFRIMAGERGPSRNSMMVVENTTVGTCSAECWLSAPANIDGCNAVSWCIIWSLTEGDISGRGRLFPAILLADGLPTAPAAAVVSWVLAPLPPTTPAPAALGSVIACSGGLGFSIFWRSSAVGSGGVGTIGSRPRLARRRALRFSIRSWRCWHCLTCW